MAKVTLNQWAKYRDSLSKICKQASDEYTYYFFNISGFKEGNGLKGVELEEAIDVANAIAQKYGYASAEVACQMYDATAKMEKANIPPAVPAEVATREETASAIVGSLKQSNTGKLVESVMYRLVKQAAADTMIQNAKRDGAKWAWVPSGDTCAFCITLASRGWQPASKAQLHGDHAEHIHGNCDCQFMISFKGGLDVEGYDPEEFKDMYYNAEGNSSRDKINYIRRNTYNSPQNQMLRLARHGNVYVSKLEKMSKYAKDIEPLDGYTDIVVHGDPYSLIFRNPDGIETNVSAEEFCDIIEKAGFYKGGKIRLIACQTGEGSGIIPTYMAKRFNTEVMAPTEIVNVDFDGNMILANDEMDAKMGIETGKWVRFDEKGRIE